MRLQLLILGIATILVVVTAWVCALFAPRSPALAIQESAWAFGAPPYAESDPTVTVSDAFGARIMRAVETQALPGIVFEPIPTRIEQVSIAAGWPCQCLFAVSDGVGFFPGAPFDGPWTVPLKWSGGWRGGLELSSQLGRDQAPAERSLPLLPIWPAFAANLAICFALLQSVPLLSALRRRRRRLRRHCVQCRHQLAPRQARCPECGNHGGAG